MRIHMESINRNLIVKISGDIDHHCSEAVRIDIDMEFTQTRSVNLIFDFSEVSFMDSSGVGMIIGRYKHVVKLGGKVMVANMRPETRRIFDMCGLRKIISIHGSVKDAAESV